MKIVDIETSEIKDWDSFHNYFSKIFGFPDFYGKNMDAWNDCMTYLDEPDSGMTTNISVNKKDYVVLNILNVTEFKQRVPHIYDALVECSAFVNYRRIESGDAPIIFLSFFN
ncbi:MAG TPA: barstar family protein [Cyclobacteriaceae bacterium]|jgi:hypothetical protein|nr:barstar family protein [Cyclobacteriaceae bacterium]